MISKNFHLVCINKNLQIRLSFFVRAEIDCQICLLPCTKGKLINGVLLTNLSLHSIQYNEFKKYLRYALYYFGIISLNHFICRNRFSIIMHYQKQFFSSSIIIQNLKLNKFFVHIKIHLTNCYNQSMHNLILLIEE